VTGPKYWVETLGCPKNAVDSDKIVAQLRADGLEPARAASEADVVVVNTCAFIEAAREESVEVLLSLGAERKPGARLVATGCMAERYGDELAAALPEADAVVGFAGQSTISQQMGVGVPVTLGRKPTEPVSLLDLPRGVPDVPWAYLKVAEGCDRACAFCAIPTFRGAQRSREPESIEREARALVEGGVREIVLVAQDLAWFGRDTGTPGALEPLLRRLDTLRADGLERIRLLYLYPSEVHDPLVATMLELPSVVPYFDLSLQHASRPLLRRMKRWGSGEQFLDLIARIRRDEPQATFRSSFISGFPGETEAMHDELLEFVEAAQLDWAGFFSFSREEGTAAANLDGELAADVVRERLAELHDVQEPITGAARAALVGAPVDVLIDRVDSDTGVAVGRSYREAPEIDGLVHVDASEGETVAGTTVRASVHGCDGTDLFASVTAVALDRAR
jgi:ribosomal protein S12 methylthiotransferase